MDAFENNLNHLLVDTFNYILKFEETSLKTMAEVHVTVSEAHLLEAISNAGGSSTVSDIAASLGIAMPTATVAVKKLESKGFVTKVPSPDDGRKYNVTLTSLGEKVDHAHSLFHKLMVKNISKSFSDDEKELLLVTVKKLSEFFRKKVE